MKELSEIALNVSPSTTLLVDALYKEMKEEGKSVIGFGAGEPDYDTPENIVDAAIVALKDGRTKYTPSNGIPALRQAITHRLKNDCSVDYKPEQIVVASGAKHNIYVTLKVLVNPGDEVILPAPYWVTYEEAIKMVGGVPVLISADSLNKFKITAKQLEAAVTNKTKLFIINNPCNPTGAFYDESEIREIAQVCVKHDLYILSDEIYYHFVYGGKKFTSFGALGNDVKERTIIINGVSKSYAMTGWRIGYTASATKIAKLMSNYLSHSTGAPSTISQYAAIEALKGEQGSVLAMRDAFEKRRNYIVERINSIDGLSCVTPDGAFYIMLNIEKQIGKVLGGKLINNSDDFSLALLESNLVALVSCSGFGCDNYARITYAASMDSIIDGLNRIENFVTG